MVSALEQPMLQLPMFAARVFVGPSCNPLTEACFMFGLTKLGLSLLPMPRPEGNNLPCWTHSQKRYQVLGKWPLYGSKGKSALMSMSC